LLVGLVALFVLGALVWVAFLPAIVASVIQSKTGFTVEIDSLSVNPFTAKVHLKGFVVKNPAGWPEAAPFVQLREFRADADLFPLLGGRLQADEVAVDVAQVTLVKNKDGVLNAVAFKEGLAGKEQPAAEQPKPAGEKPKFFIKHLSMKFDKLVYADHSGRTPAVREYNVAVNRELENVDSVVKVVSPFTGAALGIVSDAVGGMFKGSAQLLQGAGNLLKDGGQKAGETLKGLIQSLEKKKP
jgi:hypothetical protein